MPKNIVLEEFFENEVATRLAGEDFMVVLISPEQFSEEVQRACVSCVWKWSLLEMRHEPWVRADGCAKHLHLRKVPNSVELEATLVVASEEIATFRLEPSCTSIAAVRHHKGLRKT